MPRSKQTKRPPLTKQEKAQIRALNEQGLSLRSIAFKVKRSKSAVENVLGEVSTSGHKVPANTSDTPPPADDALPVLERLSRTLAVLDAANAACVAADDWSKVASLQRTIKDVVALVAKLTPPAPHDANQDPEYQRAGDQVVDKTIGRLRRIAAAAKQGATS